MQPLLSNVVAVCLAQLLQIKEVHGSNFGPEIVYPDFFVVVPNAFRQMPE
jgi:hypothetical protein